MKADTPFPQGIDPTLIIPSGANMLVRRLEPADRTIGGVYLPASVAGDEEEDGWKVSDPPSVGLVQTIGPDVQKLQRGQAIVFLPNSGVTFARDGQRYIILEEETALGTVPIVEDDF